MPYSGTLITRVFTSRGEIPLEDAAVSIVQRGENGKERLLATRLTNSSGNTEAVTIETPSPESSQSPRESQPFAVCDIWADCPGYQLLLIRDVQIFPGIESIQYLPLIPTPQAEARGGRYVTIPPQDL